MVMVDTSVLSLFLRRREPAEHPAAEVLKKLVADDQVVIAGVVCQELLSGVRSEPQFEALADTLIETITCLPLGSTERVGGTESRGRRSTSFCARWRTGVAYPSSPQMGTSSSMRDGYR
jgi:predicted nucleic acid-binding protein